MSNESAAGFTVSRLSDRAVVEAVTEGLGSEFPVTKCSLSLLLSGVHVEGLPGRDHRLDEILAAETVVVREFTFELSDGVSIVVKRTVDPQGTLLGYHDSVTVNLHPHRADQRVAVGARLLKLLRERLGAIDDKAFLDFLKEEDRTFYQAREQSLQRLQNMQEGFFEKIQEFVAQQAEAYQKKQADLDQRYAEKERQLQEAANRRTAELAEREAALAKRAQELDDRASTHVRREIRQDLKRLLTQRGQKFELTEGTKSRRRAVLIGYIVLLVALAIPAAYFLFKDPLGGGGVDSFLVVRQILLTAAFATTAGFFLRWMSRWAESHAQEEFRLKRLELDIDRASWVVEHALEWKTDKGTDIPQYLLERLSRNLFSEESPDDSAMTAADSLATAILKSASSAKFKLGDAEFDISHRGVKKLEKTELG